MAHIILLNARIPTRLALLVRLAAIARRARSLCCVSLKRFNFDEAAITRMKNRDEDHPAIATGSRYCEEQWRKHPYAHAPFPLALCLPLFAKSF
jgi:hypothetical protein